eukprot:1037995-Amphidinium_carterae.2
MEQFTEAAALLSKEAAEASRLFLFVLISVSWITFVRAEVSGNWWRVKALLLLAKTEGELEHLVLSVIEAVVGDAFKKMCGDVANLKESNCRKMTLAFLRAVALQADQEEHSLIPESCVRQILQLVVLMDMSGGKLAATKTALSTLCPGFEEDTEAPMVIKEEDSMLRLLRQASGVALVSAQKEYLRSKGKEIEQEAEVEKVESLLHVGATSLECWSTHLPNLVEGSNALDKLVAKKFHGNLRSRLTQCSDHLTKVRGELMDYLRAQACKVIDAYVNKVAPKEQGETWDEIEKEQSSKYLVLFNGNEADNLEALAKMTRGVVSLVRWLVLRASASVCATGNQLTATPEQEMEWQSLQQQVKK